MPEGNAKILVVDDSEIVLELVAMYLQDAGFQVATLGSAFQLVQAIHQELPDLILLDVKMPALGGDKAASILRQRSFSKNIPVLLFSDMEEEELAGLVQETGATGYVRKTMDGEELAATVRRWLKKTAAAEQSSIPGAATPETPTLAPKALQGLRRIGELDNESLVRIINLCLTQIPQRLTKLQEAIRARDVESIQGTAHFVKGTALTLGAQELTELCALLEKSGKTGELDEAERQLVAVEEEYRRLEPELRALLAQSAESAPPPRT